MVSNKETQVAHLFGELSFLKANQKTRKMKPFFQGGGVQSIFFFFFFFFFLSFGFVSTPPPLAFFFVPPEMGDSPPEMSNEKDEQNGGLEQHLWLFVKDLLGDDAPPSLSEGWGDGLGMFAFFIDLFF